MPKIPPIKHEFDRTGANTAVTFFKPLEESIWSNSGFDWDKFLAENARLKANPPTPNTDPATGMPTAPPITVSPQVNLPSILQTGPLNAYTAPAPAPAATPAQPKVDRFSPLASQSMDLWDYKRPDYGGTSVTGAANWSDMLNFGG